jgi:hypothetical protein
MIAGGCNLFGSVASEWRAMFLSAIPSRQLPPPASTTIATTSRVKAAITTVFI